MRGATTLVRAVAALAIASAVVYSDDVTEPYVQVFVSDDMQHVLPQAFASAPDAVAGHPFVAPRGSRGIWASASAGAEPFGSTDASAEDAWAALVCSSKQACPSAADTGRRLAASSNLTLPKPSADDTVTAIADQASHVFGAGAVLTSLPTFMGDVLDSNLLSIMGMVMSPAVAVLEPSFGDLWGTISTKLLQLAGEVARYVDVTKNKIEFEIQHKQFADNQGRIAAFWSQVKDLKQDPGPLCQYPYAPVVIFEQLAARATTYREVARKVCLTFPDCVEKLGLRYVSGMVLGYRNAMMCTALTAGKESRKGIAAQRSAQIGTVAAGFRNDMNDVRRKLTDSGEDARGSVSIANATATIATETSERDRAKAAAKANLNYDWLDLEAVSWTTDDAIYGEHECGTKFRFDGPKEDVSQGMRVDEKNRLLVVWEPKTAPAIETTRLPLSYHEALEKLEAAYNSYPADEKFGFAVLPQIETVPGKSSAPPGEPDFPETIAKCVGVLVVAVHGKPYNPAEVNAKDVTLSKDNQAVIDAAYGDDDVSRPAGATGVVSEGAAVAYFNGITNDARAKTDLAGAFAASDLAKTLGARDPAILTGPLLGFGLLDKSTNNQITMMDGIEDYLIKTTAVEVGMIKGFTTKMDRYFPEEMQGLTKLGDSMATWHDEEMNKYNEIDGNVDTLGATVTNGFSACSSVISDVQAAISSDLSGLKNQVVVSAEETRRVVKSVLDRTTQRTLGALDQLSGSIRAVHEQTMAQISGINNVIVQRNEQLRGAIRQEFYENQVQTQAMVASATTLVVAAARATTSALLSEVDAVENALTTQLRAIASNVDVVQGQLVLLETQFANVQKQVDKMLAFLASIQHTSNEILSAVGSYPEALRKALFASNLDKLLLSYKKLNYAFTKYVESGLAPVYRNDLLTACTTYANTDDLFRSFTNLISVTTSPDRLEQHVAQFEYSTKNYEQFGNQLIVAAYNTQRLSLVCARLQKNLDADAFLRLANSWDVVVDSIVGLHVVNVEENVPRFFLSKYYTEPVLTKYLTEERALWSPTTDATSAPPFALAAIESLRYRLQQQVDGFTAVSVLNAVNASQLELWTLESGRAMLGLNRYGASRVRGDLVVLWSNTRKELPATLRERLQQIELPAATTTASLGAAFNGTPWQPYWDAGLVRAVARVAKVDDACPWAIARSHYPFCWERADACHCVQLEGLPDAPSAAQMADRALVPTDVALFTTFESPSDPRSEFLTTATRQSRADASDAGLGAAMRGVPANRVRFSLCLTSEPVHAARLAATGDAHQPPPQFTRCLASDKRVYNVLPDALVMANASSASSSTFVRTGSAVSETMFRTLAIGDTVPEVTFFDAQDGAGNYIVCANCVMDELRTVFMFRVLSFKLGRPAREKSVVCERHPRLPNVEYCPATASTSTSGRYWTPPVLLGAELPRLVAHVGAGLEPGLADRVAMAEKLSAGLQSLLGVTTTDDFAYFKVYVAPAGAFDHSTDAYWTSLPSHADREERGWSVVPAFYATRAPAPAFPSDDDAPPATLAFDALVMWSTLPAEPRRVAYHIVNKKPQGVSLQSYLASAFAAYKAERILRGFFSEQMPVDATECPVAGDADHFAYCTPAPVDAHCLCVQLEDLPDEYRELYDGQHAPHGHVVSFAVAPDGDGTASASVSTASYLVGRSAGSSAPPNRAVLVDGRPWRNVSDLSLCLQTDFSHPERGATCVVAPGSTGSSTSSEPRGLRVQLTADAAAAPSVVVGERVPEVYVATPTWNARCRGCTDAVVSEMVQFQDDAQDVHVLFAGLVAGSECATVNADGGGELTVCIVD